MPPPRRLSPRRKDRRSRSHSPKVLHKKRRSRTRSPVRERKRSRSPYRKRSRSRERHHSPQRRRSRTPERLSPPRRKSLGTKRRSSSPHDYDQPIKRQADSTRRTYRSKSRSHSPLPVKKDSRRDESPEDRGYSRRRSPSPTYGGKLYSDQQSSSSKRNQRKDEIEMVKIVDMGKKLPKLDKRFQTLEQLAQGSFDFEENITIGIHRGPHGHQLDNDEDIPVNYNFNPKTFIMLFPKKDYTIPVFDRDEIKAFHHDDILDEEAYVEKRTITVKPTGKPKPSTSRGSGGGSSSRYRDMDYKITIGADRSSSYGDRRMVHDSGSSKSRSSRHDPEVKIRLDPKPDPKYERMYKEQQRQENRNLEDKIHRNPSDLRYSLMRKKSFDGDRESDRGRGRDSSLLDARARIEAKRQGGTDQGDYGSRDMSPPPTRMEKRKIGIKTELPDFKNRPGKPIENPEVWIIGASVIKDIAHAQQDDKLPQLIKLMKDTVKSIKWHGESDMNIKDLLPAVKYMLKENDTKPDIIIFQCGEYDVCVGRNVDHQSVMKDHVEQIMKELPGVKLIWSQTFPPWMTTEPAGESLAKSRRRINRFMIKVFCSEEVDGAFIYHPHFRTNRKAKFFKDKHDGFLHLTNPGLEMYLMQLKAGINYIMSGQGCIYPYIQWPPISMARIPPEDICMLCKEHILDINEHMIYGMSKDQIQQFSNDQIEMFQPLQKQWLYCQYFIENLSQDQVKAFTLDQYKFMNLDQLLIWREEHGSVLSEEVLTYLTKKEKVLRKRMRNKNAEMNENGESEWSEDSLDEEEYDFEAYEDERYDMVEVREKVRTGRGRGRGNFRGRGRGRGDFRGRGREDFRGRGRGGFRGRGRGDFRGRGRGGFQSSGNDHERSENFDYDRGSPSEFDARNYSRQSDDLILGERFESRGRHRSRERRRSTESDHRRRSRSGHRRSGSRRVPSRDRRRRRHSSESSYSSESDYMSESRSRSPSPRRRRKQGRGSPNRNNHPHPGPHFPPGFPPGPMGFPPLQPPGMPMPPMGMPLGFPTPQYPYMPPPPPGSVPVHFPYPVPGPFLPNPAAPVQPDPTVQVYVPASSPEPSSSERSAPFSKYNRWGYCEICKVPLNSEIQAIEHINGLQHLEKEVKRDKIEELGSRAPTVLYVDGRKVSDDDDDGGKSYREDEAGRSYKEDEAGRSYRGNTTGQLHRRSSPDIDDKFKYDEWTDNPEIIPKGASYFEHDSRARDDMNYWERKQMFIETGKTFSRGSPRGRGSFMRGRGRGRARGIQRNDFVRPRGGGKIRTPAMDEWKHDKFDEVDTDNQSAEKDRSIDTRFKIDRKGTKDEAKKDRKGHGDHPSAKRSDRTISIKEEEAALNKDSNVSVQ